MDAYQQAVEWLTEHPEQIADAWNHPCTKSGGCIFRWATKDGGTESWLSACGCLSMVRSGRYLAGTDALTSAIRLDERIPPACTLAELGVTVDHLPVFAGWQRRIDKLLNRKPPEMDPRIPLPTKEVEFVELPALEGATP